METTLKKLQRQLKALQSSRPTSVMELEALKTEANNLAEEAIGDLEALSNLLQNVNIVQLSREIADSISPKLGENANVNIFDGVSDFHGFGGVNPPYHVDG